MGLCFFGCVLFMDLLRELFICFVLREGGFRHTYKGQ